MKRVLLTITAVFALFQVASAQCNQLFFSEYIEGTNNNKALEIYNPTPNPINLNAYRLVRYANGTTTPDAVTISGIIQPYGTFVTVLDKTDTMATGQDTAVFAALLAKADTLLCPVYNVNKMHYFNGDDAVTLELLNGTFLDIIGKIGEDPGVAWTCDTAAGFTDALGGTWMTANKTLIRKPTVNGGITVNPPFFNPCAEWDALPVNTFTELGQHACECDPSYSINEYRPAHHAFIFPNPVKGGEPFMVKGTRIIKQVELYTANGQLVGSFINPADRGDITIQPARGLQSGLLLVKITFEDQRQIMQKVVVR
jgi:hypothetical protein